jgi:hypothetical protein
MNSTLKIGNSKILLCTYIHNVTKKWQLHLIFNKDSHLVVDIR